MGRANPEEEGCKETQEGEKRTRRTSARLSENKKERPASEDEAKMLNHRKTEESGAKSEEAERARETDFPAKSESTKKDAVTTRNVPGGTWLLQILVSPRLLQQRSSRQTKISAGE
ncbi:hypothetical protein NDU88_005370 [Pleurodeles waltl]|uniref:Uncharacterized protein n=1 Tax=Pleurodeles waltl TaxID=8319 RepID=A0AAV7LMN9_PLEWA|nr:hypothetical protein NDU88_005370 [Pleurodeles waltl]